MNSKLIFTIGSGLLASFLALGGCASTSQNESTGQYIDSSALTMKVKTKLLSDDSVKSLPITVKTYKDIVQLSGFVDNQYQKNKADEIARSVPGVRDVQDSLIIKRR
jgi:osmotically-inducible protein OsmY